MADFAALRTKMVDSQVRPSDVTDLRIIDAMLATPREAFAPEKRRQLAYLDADLPVGEAETSRVLIQPRVFAKLLQAAAIRPTDKVLEIGTATSYGAAVLSHLAAAVVAVEVDPALADLATRTLADRANVTVVKGNLADGAPKFGPYDVIVLNGSVEQLPEALGRQLKDGGRLLVVEGVGNAASARLYRLAGTTLSGRDLFNAALPLLPGFARAATFAF